MLLCVAGVHEEEEAQALQAGAQVQIRFKIYR